MRRVLSAPAAVNLEITDACNLKCGHCYNFWREEGDRTTSITKQKMDELIDIFVDSGIFHVVLTGGEPFVRFELLEYAIEKLIEKNISVSCNSNLTLATEDKIKRLRDAGLDHILTSLNSYDQKTNDMMVNKKGAFDKILNGIHTAVNNGIRVSSNMIVSHINKDHVYQTGKLCAELGCQKIFGTRVVPSVNLSEIENSKYTFSQEEALHTLNELLKVRDETGIMIGTLVSYPLCFLGDLEKYKDFVGRGCPAQRGRVIGINANGETHACVHESKSYGNIYEIGIKAAYRNMIDWHCGNYHFTGCKGCQYINVCETGCRISANAYFKGLDKQDYLMTNQNDIKSHYKIVYDSEIYSEIDKGLRFFVPDRLRFRKEKDFYLVSIRWANTIIIEKDDAEFLIDKIKTGKDFDIKDFGLDKKEMLARFFFKDVVESKSIKYDDLKSKDGLSIELSALL